MLAGILQDIPSWQWPLMGLLAFVWLVGGGYLFQKSLKRLTQARRVSLGRGVLVSLLSGGAGLFAAGALYLIGSAIFPPHPKPGELPLSIPGAILAFVGFLVVSYLVVFAMSKLDAGATFRAWIGPIGGTVVLGTILLFFCGKSIQQNRRENARLNDQVRITQIRFNQLFRALADWTQPNPPKTLDELVQAKGLDPQTAQSPTDPNGKGFFYLPARPAPQQEGQEDKILICDRKSHFGKKGRTVLFSYGEIQFFPPEAFEVLLQEPENREFARALREAEGSK